MSWLLPHNKGVLTTADWTTAGQRSMRGSLKRSPLDLAEPITVSGRVWAQDSGRETVSRRSMAAESGDRYGGLKQKGWGKESRWKSCHSETVVRGMTEAVQRSTESSVGFCHQMREGWPSCPGEGKVLMAIFAGDLQQSSVFAETAEMMASLFYFPEHPHRTCHPRLPEVIRTWPPELSRLTVL